MKKSIKKLTLAKETLRSLDEKPDRRRRGWREVQEILGLWLVRHRLHGHQLHGLRAPSGGGAILPTSFPSPRWCSGAGCVIILPLEQAASSNLLPRPGLSPGHAGRIS